MTTMTPSWIKSAIAAATSGRFESRAGWVMALSKSLNATACLNTLAASAGVLSGSWNRSARRPGGISCFKSRRACAKRNVLPMLRRPLMEPKNHRWLRSRLRSAPSSSSRPQNFQALAMSLHDTWFRDARSVHAATGGCAESGRRPTGRTPRHSASAGRSAAADPRLQGHRDPARPRRSRRSPWE